VNAHHKLISEVRAVLKTLAKEEAEDSDCGAGSTIQEYLRDYKLFSEKLTTLLKTATQDKITEQLRDSVTTLVNEVELDLDGIFMKLFDIAKPMSSSLEGKKSPESSGTTAETTGQQVADNQLTVQSTGDTVTNTTSVVSSTVTSSAAPGASKGADLPGDRVMRDPKTGKAVQERNSYAVSVWRRVKMKLDGRDLDPNKKMSVSDQVSYIIAEACDIKNLAQMYEGWTSWV